MQFQEHLFSIIRDIFRTQSTICDGAIKPFNDFHRKAQSQIFDWVLNTHLLIPLNGTLLCVCANVWVFEPIHFTNGRFYFKVHNYYKEIAKGHPYLSLKDKNTRFYSQCLQCAGTNFGKSVFIWLNGYSFVNTPLPHFPVSIIPVYMNLFKGFCCLLRTCFCQMDFKFLFFCLINISKFRWQTWINLFFLPVPTRINRMNKFKFLFSHFFLSP